VEYLERLVISVGEVINAVVRKSSKEMSEFPRKDTPKTEKIYTDKVEANEDVSEDTNGLIHSISKFLDDKLYEPYFQTQAGVFESSLSESMTDLKEFRQIDDLLRNVKIISFVATPLLFVLSLRNLNSKKPVEATIFGALCADSLRLSYNCYIKNYCCISLKRMGENADALKVGTAFFQWAKTAIGVENKTNPFTQLKEEILIETVTTGCIIANIYRQVQNFISRMK